MINIDWDERKLYLPESDEAISFAMASHEIGHLVAKGRIEPSADNFDSTYQEEKRAWNVGWEYLEKYLDEYYKDEPRMIVSIKKIKEAIEKITMDITLLTKPFYGKTGDEEKQRENFAETKTGKEIKKRMDEIEDRVAEEIKKLDEPRLAKKIDWGKYCEVVKKALLDIEEDNKKTNN